MTRATKRQRRWRQGCRRRLGSMEDVVVVPDRSSPYLGEELGHRSVFAT